MVSQIPLASVSFSISGDRVDPDFWSQYFGVAPDIAHRKGQPFVTKTGQSLLKRTGVWVVTSGRLVSSDVLTPHFDCLIDRLGLPRDGFAKLPQRSELWVRFFCYWNNESRNRVPDIPERVKYLAASQAIDIDIDEFK
ncbi:DUF4279 domain-containing protein [Burkholderia gladioli]|uniref:DUF4279 domain-containing protein n=1 Tax=Burkholderia gladioli TaxID=28095 RepID=UPI001641E249|nr:DUF4279 domain-containing protein [Burkholderia gladioli]